MRILLFYIKLILFFVVIIYASCAQIVAPTGGNKDIIPPKIEKENPNNKCIHFNSTKISIRFDEFIQLKNIDEQVIISPPMVVKPLFNVNGKEVEITLRSNLNPNTTYTINFANSIVDNHENNVFSNYNYVFSTGSFIDSFSIKGLIKNAFTNVPEKGMSVCLYSIDGFTDSTIYNHKPLYFTKSNENGYFKLENLPEKSFQLITFKDENKNLLYDKNETISFYDSIINTTDTSQLITSYSFKQNPYLSNKLLDTIAKDVGRFQFVIFKPEKVIVKPKYTNNYNLWYSVGKDNIDTITLFNPLWNKDSVWFVYKIDSIDTSFYLKPRKSAKQLKFTSLILKTVELNDSFTIQFNQPVEKIIYDTSKIVLKEDSIVIIPYYSLSPNKDYIKLYYPLKSKTHYSLSYKDSAFMDIYGHYNQKEKVLFTTKENKDYSTLILNLVHPNDGYQYIIQILNIEETKLYKELKINQSGNYNLEYITPSKYKIKIIRDINRNGKWDNGDYQTKKQPEKIYYFPEVLLLRANWDLEQQINLNKIVN
jgi:hypothetical protein